MTVAQGGIYSDKTVPIRTAAGVLVADGISAGTVTLSSLTDSADVSQSSGATLLYAGGGMYRVTKMLAANAALGNWTVIVAYLEAGQTVPREFVDTFQVVTAAQADPVDGLVDGLAAGLAPVVSSAVTSAVAALEGVNITVVSPVANSESFDLIRGDDYLAADARALTWSTTSAAQWPDLTGATIAFTARRTSTVPGSFTGTGSVITPAGATKQVQVEITAAATTGKTASTYRFDVEATLASGSKVTLVTGRVRLKDDQTV